VLVMGKAGTELGLKLGLQYISKVPKMTWAYDFIT